MKNRKPDIAELLVKQTDFLENNNVMAYVGCMVDDNGGCQVAIIGNGAYSATGVLALLRNLHKLDPDAAHKVVDAFMLEQIVETLGGGKDEVNKKG